MSTRILREGVGGSWSCRVLELAKIGSTCCRALRGLNTLSLKPKPPIPKHPPMLERQCQLMQSGCSDEDEVVKSRTDLGSQERPRPASKTPSKPYTPKQQILQRSGLNTSAFRSEHAPGALYFLGWASPTSGVNERFRVEDEGLGVHSRSQGLGLRASTLK